MTDTATTVAVKNITLTKKTVRLVSKLGRVIWKKIRHWRGLRKSADVTPIVK